MYRTAHSLPKKSIWCPRVHRFTGGISRSRTFIGSRTWGQPSISTPIRWPTSKSEWSLWFRGSSNLDTCGWQRSCANQSGDVTVQISIMLDIGIRVGGLFTQPIILQDRQRGERLNGVTHNWQNPERRDIDHNTNVRHYVLTNNTVTWSHPKNERRETNKTAVRTIYNNRQEGDLLMDSHWHHVGRNSNNDVTAYTPGTENQSGQLSQPLPIWGSGSNHRDNSRPRYSVTRRTTLNIQLQPTTNQDKTTSRHPKRHSQSGINKPLHSQRRWQSHEGTGFERETAER